jgi:AcrR family transcriptional regulator
MEQIYCATLELVLDKGLAGANMCGISKAAGIATGTCYIYFKSKDELILELFSICRKKSAAFYFREFDEEKGFEFNFRKFFMNVMEFRIKHFRTFIFLEQFYHSPFVTYTQKKSTMKMLEPMYRLLDEGKEQGIIRDMENELIVGFLLGSINEVVKKAHYRKKPVEPAMIQELFGMCWNGIKRG